MNSPILKFIVGINIIAFVFVVAIVYSSYMNEKDATELCQKIERAQDVEKIPEFLDERQKKWLDGQMKNESGRASYRLSFTIQRAIPMLDTQATCIIKIEDARITETEIVY